MIIPKLYSTTKGSILRCPIASLLLISLFFSLSGCSSSVYNSLEPSIYKPANWEKSPMQLVENQSLLYKMELSVYGNYFSGMMLFKSMPDGSKRINLITEAGIKLFDFELKDNQFNTIFVLQQLNKRIIIKTLESDLKLLLFSPHINETECYIDKINSRTVLKTGKLSKPQFYMFSYPQDTLTGIECYSGNKVKMGVQLKYNSDHLLSELVIKHENIPLEMGLRLLKSNTVK